MLRLSVLGFRLAALNNGLAICVSMILTQAKEETGYVESILEDYRWLGLLGDRLYYASDYFEKCTNTQFF